MINRLVKSFVNLIKNQARRWLPQKPPPPVVATITRSDASHYSLKDLLTQLPKYRKTVVMLKKFDADAYALYSKVGGVIVSDALQVRSHQLEPIWKTRRPTFSFVHFERADQDEDKIAVAAMYITKTKRVTGVQLMVGDTYECHVFYGAKEASETFNCVYYINITPHGEIVPLRQLISKRNDNHRHIPPQKVWDYPTPIKDIAKENDWPSTQAFMVSIFCLVANFTVGGVDGFMVSARKGGVACRFYIDMLRTPYFFKDREKVKTATGKTKRIFHIVRPHARGNKFIKTHFRGVRRFLWQGYDVTVSMPGFHHTSIEDFTATTEQNCNDLAGKITPGEAGQLMARHIQ